MLNITKVRFNDSMDTGQWVFIILMAVSLSACAGLRAFIPPLIVSILAMSGYVTLAPQFQWLGRWEVALLFGLAAVLEIIADKYPGVDHALDMAGLVIKPAVGTVIAAGLFTQLDPLVALSLGLILGGGSAGLVHLGKAKLRLLSTSFTAGFANPIVSLGEDICALIWGALAAFAPYLAALLLLLGGIVAFRWLRHRPRRPAVA
jgi:uncharacterized membrane protein